MEETSPNNPNAFSHKLPHPVYAMAISSSPSSLSPLLALGSFLDDLPNALSLLSFHPDSLSFRPHSPPLDHPFPPTKLLFHPSSPSLLASSSDHLRLFHLTDHSLQLRTALRPTRPSSPLTSFDWNRSHPHRIATCSVDTTCTVWDVDRALPEARLIAHDREVYDIAWGQAAVFSTVSADGSVRMFDLRDKEHSNIIYECDTSLLRLAWNSMDLTYMATIVMDSDKIIVLDIRAPGSPVAVLAGHQGSVNGIAWAPDNAGLLCSVGDDGRALVWELAGKALTGTEGVEPRLSYSAGEEINQVQWSAAHPEWVGIAVHDRVQMLRF